MGCKVCGGNEIEHDPSQGMSYCLRCGEVCEENTIVSEVTFGEAASGAAIVQGSFVRAGQTRANMGGPGRLGSGQESRETTLYNSRRRIQRLATALNLSEHYIDSAQRYFTLALNQNFSRGRRSLYVSAACLYIVCRIEKNSQMLIDFSDIMQVSVFKLGSTFARLVNVLNIQLPIVDPSLYISRFASMLEFGDKTQQVCMDAIRLVQRMDRDWIRTGRRPAGICGACLLISARMHNFRRTQREIIRVVKIADTTLRRRLDEFRNTPSGNLSVFDFRSLWLEQSADPPAFTNGRIKARKALLAQQQVQNERTRLQVLQSAPSSVQDSLRRRIYALGEEIADAASGSSGDSAEAESNEAEDQEIQDEINTYLNQERLKFISRELASQDFDPDVSTWSDLDDDEVQNIMLNEEEVRLKSEIWDRENKEFVEEQERKRQAREQDSGSRKRRRSTRKKVVIAGATPLESTQNMLATRRLSKKINYDVLGKLLVSDNAKPKAEPVHSTMIPSAAPSRMLSAVGSPTSMSGHATPTQQTFVGGGTQKSQIDSLPTALAGIYASKKEETETIIYEEDEHDDLQGTAVDRAKAAIAATAAADQDDEDDDDSDEEEGEQYADTYADDIGGYDGADSD
ncbi:transcription factor TFIIIB subunit brf1 [Coemansia sp. RSA 1939]|nr:transcription factor TFIIIB subunit brf1 [Coemansia sp. RSA 1939]KAJ2608298.1 transcription factor TFIIIB subunit brf1 [Coemansia sp. RSA 1804]